MARRLLLAALLAALWAAGAGDANQPRNGRCGPLIHIKNAVAEDSGNMKVRYTCVEGYKRKAGTSSLVVCEANEETKTYEWNFTLICIHDPSRPEPVPMTEGTGKDTETPTPTSRLAPPQTSANSVAVSRDPYGSDTVQLPELSAVTTLPTTAKPSPEESTAVGFPQEIGRGVSDADRSNVMPHKETTTQDAPPDRSKPSSYSSTPFVEIRHTTAVFTRSTPKNTTGVSEADVPQGQTGSSQLQAVLLPVVFILALSVIAGLLYYYKTRSRFQRPRNVVVEEIPMAERSEERGPMLSADGDTEGAGPAREETLMQPSDCATATG